MAQATKCDRCGRYFDENGIVAKAAIEPDEVLIGVSTRTAYKKTDERFDLCDKCIGEFFNFMAGLHIEGIEGID